MEEIIVGIVEQLYENVKGQNVYIYGAKSVAIRTCKSLEIMGDACTWFCSIKKYDNPCQ